jgi:hypothetical protein
LQEKIMQKAIALGFTVSCLALCGCHSEPPPTLPTPLRADPVSMQNYPNIEVEQILGPWMVGSDPVVSNDGGIMKVMTPIRFEGGPGAHDLGIQYKYTFFDAKGMPLAQQNDY